MVIGQYVPNENNFSRRLFFLSFLILLKPFFELIYPVSDIRLGSNSSLTTIRDSVHKEGEEGCEIWDSDEGCGELNEYEG
jgi:hypothetical protein